MPAAPVVKETDVVQARSFRRHLPALLAWTVLCALFFLTILTGSERLITSDFSGQFHAFGLFQAREMAQGHLPAWSPGSPACPSRPIRRRQSTISRAG